MRQRKVTEVAKKEAGRPLTHAQHEFMPNRPSVVYLRALTALEQLS